MESTTGQRLKMVREAMDLTLAQFGALIPRDKKATPASTVSNMENDRVSISLERFRQISEAIRKWINEKKDPELAKRPMMDGMNLGYVDYSYLVIGFNSSAHALNQRNQENARKVQELQAEIKRLKKENSQLISTNQNLSQILGKNFENILSNK